MSTSEDVILHKIKFQVTSWVSLRPVFKGISLDSLMSNWKEVAVSGPCRLFVHPCWSPPPLRPLKFNFDGSVIGNPRSFVIGGII